MKKTIIILLIFCICLSGCNSNNQKTKTTNETTESATESSTESIDTFNVRNIEYTIPKKWHLTQSSSNDKDDSTNIVFSSPTLVLSLSIGSVKPTSTEDLNSFFSSFIKAASSGNAKQTTYYKTSYGCSATFLYDMTSTNNAVYHTKTYITYNNGNYVAFILGGPNPNGFSENELFDYLTTAFKINGAMSELGNNVPFNEMAVGLIQNKQSSSKKGQDETTTSIPSDYINALKKAKSYSNSQHMSKKRLYDQLTSEYGEKFPADAAQYAIDNLKADYKANALAKAKSYQTSQNMSKNRIYDQLTSDYGEMFTPDEAQYAIDNLN